MEVEAFEETTVAETQKIVAAECRVHGLLDLSPGHSWLPTQPSRLTRHKATGRRYRIGLVTNPSSAESGVRVEAPDLSGHHPDGWGNRQHWFQGDFRQNSAHRTECLFRLLILEAMEKKDPGDFRLRASLV